MTFHSTLQRLREAAGHSSARAFFLKNGGSRFFGCTYKQYRNAEAGRSVPSPRLTDRVAEALRLGSSPAAGRRFMEAYLRALLGSERLVAMALGSGSHGSASAVDAAMTRVHERPRHLSRAQTDFMYAKPENYWALFIMVSDSGTWSPDELARVSGHSPARMRKALAGLRRHKLAAPGRDGRWRSPLFEVPMIMAAPTDPGKPRLHEIAEKHLGLADGKGETVLRQLVVVRASAAELEHYKPLLLKTLQGVGIFATTEAGPDTALFAVDARVRRVARL